MKDLTVVTDLLLHLPPYTHTCINIHTEFSGCVLQSAHAFPSHACPITSPVQLLSLCLIPLHGSSQLLFQEGRGPGCNPWSCASFPGQTWAGEALLFIWLASTRSTFAAPGAWILRVWAVVVTLMRSYCDGSVPLAGGNDSLTIFSGALLIFKESCR